MSNSVNVGSRPSSVPRPVTVESTCRAHVSNVLSVWLCCTATVRSGETSTASAKSAASAEGRPRHPGTEAQGGEEKEKLSG